MADRNVALFTTSDINNISSVTRLDAVGFGTNTDSGPGVCDLFREGNNLPATSGSTLEYSFFRKALSSGNPQDTHDNSADFLFADTQATPLVYNSTTFQRLGAPWPLHRPARVDGDGDPADGPNRRAAGAGRRALPAGWLGP